MSYTTLLIKYINPKMIGNFDNFNKEYDARLMESIKEKM